MSAKRSDNELLLYINQVTKVLHELGAALQLPPADLATMAAGVCANIHFWAHRGACVEQMRTAIDVFERQLLEDGRLDP